jgi:MFS family permease
MVQSPSRDGDGNLHQRRGLRYGWRIAFEVFGWSSAGLLLLCAALLFRPPVVAGRKGPGIMGTLRTRAFFFVYVSLLFARVAMYVSMVYLPAYSAEIGVGRVAGAALVGYIGGSSIGGRLGFDALASRFGLLWMYQAAYAILLASFVPWLIAGSYFSLLVFTLVMGVGHGGLAALYAPVTASMFGIEKLGELLGILFTGFGIGSLIGPPLAAILVDYTHNYQYPVFVAAAAAALAFLLVLPLRKQAMIQTKQSAPQRIDRQRLPNKSCQFRAKIEESEEENAQKSMAMDAGACELFSVQIPC